ncbi:MAG: nitrilase-related carbon-nitrogen hydrolase [Nitriliruptoraceae bacterium]
MRIAAVQPRSHANEDEHRNVDDALRWMERASAAAASLIIFPEGYPGPTNPRNTFDGLSPLRDAARDLSLCVIAGHLAPAGDGTHHVVLSHVDADGSLPYTYRRTTPEGPYIYQDIPVWAFDYSAADDMPRVTTLAETTVGSLVCSEVYVPELSRILALQGAQLLAFPAGGAINELRDSWRTMVRARAIENLAYSVAVQNLYDRTDPGVGIIAGPEGDLATATGEGLLVADLDLDRLDWLRREQEKIVFPKPYATIPGVLEWRRPTLYASLTVDAPEE